MAAESPLRMHGGYHVVAVVMGLSSTLGCHDVASPAGQRGPGELEPRAGEYVVAEFEFRNDCADPAYGLSGTAATTRSAMFRLTPESPNLGAVVLSGVLQVANPAAGYPDVLLLEGPDTGRYRIAGDTLRLFFPKEINGWVGVLRFTQYRGGQLAGVSRSNCRSLSLRLERQP